MPNWTKWLIDGGTKGRGGLWPRWTQSGGLQLSPNSRYSQPQGATGPRQRTSLFQPKHICLDPGGQLGGDGQKRKWRHVLGYWQKVSLQHNWNQVRWTEMNKEAREGNSRRTEMSSHKAHHLGGASRFHSHHLGLNKWWEAGGPELRWLTGQLLPTCILTKRQTPPNRIPLCTCLHEGFCLINTEILPKGCLSLCPSVHSPDWFVSTTDTQGDFPPPFLSLKTTHLPLIKVGSYFRGNIRQHSATCFSAAECSSVGSVWGVSYFHPHT